MNDTAERNRRINKRVLTGIGYVAVLILGVAMGASTGDEATTADAPEPEVVTETETVTEEVEVTPPSCLDALDATEVMLNDGVVPTIEAAQASYQALAAFDPVAMESALTDLESVNAEVEGLVADYAAAAVECRDAS